VETEQLIELSSPKGTVLSSFVQLRGSIPLMWSQIPNIKYKPTTRIAPPDTYARAFDRHVTDLLDIYKVGWAPPTSQLALETQPSSGLACCWVLLVSMLVCHAGCRRH
jgi:SacI homology domain